MISRRAIELDVGIACVPAFIGCLVFMSLTLQSNGQVEILILNTFLDVSEESYKSFFRFEYLDFYGK